MALILGEELIKVCITTALLSAGACCSAVYQTYLQNGRVGEGMGGILYSKTCLKRPLKKKTKIGFQD